MTWSNWLIIVALTVLGALLFWFELAQGNPQAVWECQIVRLCAPAPM